MNSQPLIEIRHHHVRAQGLRFHIAEAGPPEGTPVLLLHGFPECWYSFRHQLTALGQAGFRAMAPDLRGYNLTDKPPNPKDYEPEVLAEDVVAVANALGYKRLDVVGHDWGGAIAFLVASFPATKHVVRRLCVLNAPHPALFLSQLSISQLRKSWYMLFFQLPRIPEWLLSRQDFAGLRRIFSHTNALRQRLSETDYFVYKQAMQQTGALSCAIHYYRAIVRSNPLRLSEKTLPIDAETLLIWGEQDAALGKELTFDLARAVPHLLLHYLPAGHFVHLEQPEEVNRLLLDFLQKPL